MKMSVTREIARPAGEGFDYLADVSDNPSWQKGMQSCEWTSELPIGSGSTYSQHARFMGKSIKSSVVVNLSSSRVDGSTARPWSPPSRSR